MKRSIKSLLVAAALGAAVIAGASIGQNPTETAHAAPPLGADGSIADVAERVLPSVVNISTTTVVTRATTPFENDPFFEDYFRDRRPPRERYGQSLGSGVIVSSKGYILTNSHVVANAKDIKVSLSDGRDLTATLVGADPKSDLAVLKLKGTVPNLRAIPMGDSDKMRLGDVVIAIGNPFGVGQAVTMGIVSAKGRANMGIVDYEDFIQTDAAINPGNSGGALINLRGELIGINTAILSRTGGYQGIGFAIPTGMARPIMESLISKGKVVRGWLGVSIQDVNRELVETLKLKVERGVLIAGVVPSGPAAKAGLQRGDVVVRINNRACEKSVHLRNAIAAGGVGKPVQMEIVRGNKRQTLAVVLGEMPKEDGPLPGGRGGEGRAGSGDKLGLRVAPLDGGARAKYDIPRDVTHGVVVTSVGRGSVAEANGLQPGDVVMEINRVAIRSPRQLDEAYRRAGRRVALLVYRDGAASYVVMEK
ncbi:MAG TPA: DegQ family serine endoprotease [Kofleriaceae bacterium]|nr:DegQ family serine endoprotease [Kofleriaceae bacterium]